MINKGQMYVRIIAGGGLVYEGMKLIQEPISQGVENYIGYTLCGVAFVLIGVVLLIRNLARMLKKDYYDPMAAIKNQKDEIKEAWESIEEEDQEALESEDQEMKL